MGLKVAQKRDWGSEIFLTPHSSPLCCFASSLSGICCLLGAVVCISVWANETFMWWKAQSKGKDRFEYCVQGLCALYATSWAREADFKGWFCNSLTILKQSSSILIMRVFKCSLGVCTKLNWSNSKLLYIPFSHIVCDSSLIHDVHRA